MCLATDVDENGQRKRVMEDVAWIKPENDTLRLVTFLGESRRFRSKIKSIDLVNGSIILEATDE
jgi:predicted RNA-binding protein